MSAERKRINLSLANLSNDVIAANNAIAVTDVYALVSSSDIFVPTGIVSVDMTNFTRPGVYKNSTTESVFESKVIIPLYIIIFVLAVLGNTLVLVTLVRNKRMRTVTNVYLLNLAISDLLLGVFCMPFTLVGQVLRNFVFGSTMCKLIPYFQEEAIGKVIICHWSVLVTLKIMTKIICQRYLNETLESCLHIHPQKNEFAEKFQTVSVSVGVWTLVAISLERYFAICRPLKSRRWQTQFHAYKMIAFVWLASLFWSGPVLVVSSLKAMKRGHKCREVWPNPRSEQIFNLFLDVMLLLIPMLIMSLAYSLILSKLWKGLQREIQHNTSCQQQMLQRSCSSSNIHEVISRDSKLSSNSENGLSPHSPHSPLRQHRLTPPCNAKIMTTVTKNNKRKTKGSDKAETVKMWLMKGFVKVKLPHTASQEFRGYSCTRNSFVPSCKLTTPTSGTVSPKKQYSSENNMLEQKIDETTYTFSRYGIRSNYMDKSIEAKKKVIRMLFVIVAEFFICWAPLHILNTWYLFYPDDVYKYVGPTGISLVQLLAYVSSCCNPITYCFMNRKFRQAFLTAFNCRACCCLMCDESIHGTTKFHNNGILKMVQNNSDVSANESTVYLGRASTIGRSEVVVLEAEDRV